MCDMGTWDVGVAADRIVDGCVCPMDVNFVHTQGQTVASINTVCLGLIGEISVVAESLRMLGPKRYDVTAVWGLLKGYSVHTRIEWIYADGTEDSIEDDLVACFMNHTQHFGKKLRATPNAVLNDGTIRIECAARKLPIFADPDALAGDVDV